MDFLPLHPKVVPWILSTFSILRPRAKKDRERLRGEPTLPPEEAKRQRKGYFEKHGKRLRQDASVLRQEAVLAHQRLAARPGNDGWPIAASHWQHVLQSDAALQASGTARVLQAQARRSRSERLEANDLVQGEVPRLSVCNRCKPPYPTWVRKVSQSPSPLVCVRIPGNLDVHAVILIAQTRRLQPWGLRLQHAPGGEPANFILRTPIAPATIKPIQDFWQLTEEEDAATQVYAAKVAIRPDDRRSCFLVSILDIDEIKVVVAKKKVLLQRQRPRC